MECVFEASNFFNFYVVHKASISRKNTQGLLGNAHRRILFMDDVEVEQIGSFEDALHGFFTSEKPDLEKSINDTGDWNDDIEKQFTEVVEQFKKTQTF
jgi:F0F1-type ATP synthase alpha subunit